MRVTEGITVLLPTYNAMPFLREAVESILRQSFDPVELLIINDGSNDGTTEYLASLRDSDRITILHQKNCGLVATLNEGLRRAKFEWIARMDADDIAFPERLAAEARFLNANPRYDLVSCGFGYVGRAGKLAPVHVQRLAEPPRYDPLTDPVILHQGVLFRRSSVLAAGGYQGGATHLNPAEDLDLWLRMDEKGCQLASIPDILMEVRVLKDGVSAANFIRQRIAWKYVRACSLARRSGVPIPDRDDFFRINQPQGIKRVHLEGARQFRMAGAAWSQGQYAQAGLRLALSTVLRPAYVAGKFNTYFGRGSRQSSPVKGGAHLT